jgi:hypothetical protein
MVLKEMKAITEAHVGHPDTDLTGGWDGLRIVLDEEHLGTAVSANANRLHAHPGNFNTESAET